MSAIIFICMDLLIVVVFPYLARVTNPPDLNTRDAHEAYTVSSPGQLKCMYVWLCAHYMYYLYTTADSASSASTDVEDDKGNVAQYAPKNNTKFIRKQRYCTGGATNKALRNKTGSSRGRAKRGRGRSSGATTRGTHFERYLHGSVNYGNEYLCCNYVSGYFLI